MELPGKVALVTGGGAGIGRAAALRLAREGAAVVVADLDEVSGNQVVREIETGGGRGAFILADVATERDVSRMVGFAEALFGGLDVLVNNAGGVEPPFFPESEPDQWARVIDLNLRGVMLGVHFGVRAMKRRGGGAMVNISSMGGIGFQPYDKPEYGAAKAGVVRLTASLASLKEQLGIRVNCVCPGSVDTPAFRRTLSRMTSEEQAALAQSPKLQPDDIAEAVLMFVKDESMAGRVMIWPEGKPWQIIPVDAPF